MPKKKNPWDEDIFGAKKPTAYASTPSPASTSTPKPKSSDAGDIAGELTARNKQMAGYADTGPGGKAKKRRGFRQTLRDMMGMD